MRNDCKQYGEQRVGEVNYNKSGLRMKIIQYDNTSNIVIRLDNGYTRKTSYQNFKNGTVKTPYDRNTRGGYLGEGKYSYTTHTDAYKCWYSLLDRCFADDKDCTKWYEDCIVWKEWLNFQNFAKWYEENKYDFNGKVLELDKDLKCKGNKIYSPNTCLLVPHEINSLIVSCRKNRGNLPVGVTYRFNKYHAQINKDGKKIHLGSFDTLEDAFNVYKHEKECYIKSVADRYKNILPQEVYNALYEWKVELID